MAFTSLDPSLTASVQRNQLINGGFEIWQRGTNFVASLTLAYTADRWQINTDESTNVTISRDSTIIDSGVYSMKTVVTSAGASKFYRVRQKFLEEAPSYSLKTVTFSCRVLTSVANAVKIAIGDQSAIQARSAYHTGSGNWETLTVTYTFGSGITEATFFIGMLDAGDKKNGTYYYDSAVVVSGSNAALFQTEDSALALTRCQRYYEISSSNMVNVVPIEHSGSANGLYIPTQFKVTKRAAPTFTPTKNGVFLYHTPTTGNGSITDTANWAFGGSDPQATGSNYSFISRTAGDQTTYSVAEIQWSWIADAEV